MADLLIRGGWIIDGSGAPGYRGDVAIADGRIVHVGPESGPETGAVLDASGLAVAPGFIDIHTHSDLALLGEPTLPFKVTQGVTTEVLGNCGFSAAPQTDASREPFRALAGPVFGHDDIEWAWGSLTDYLERLETAGIGINAATLVGHGALRGAVVGFERRAPTEAELAAMQRELAACLEAGAVGLSTGLIYTPGCYAETDELIALAEVLGRHGAVYATHLRDQSDHLLEAVQEALAIGRRGHAAVQISHHKCAGKANRGKVRDSLALLDAAETEGLHTGSDMYPYLAGSSSLVSLFPPWSLEGGVTALLARIADAAQRERIERDFRQGLPGWENRTRVAGWESIFISSVAGEADPRVVGRNLAELAAERGIAPEAVACDLVQAAQGKVGYIGYNSSEADVETVMRHPRTSIGSDGLDVGPRPHPRLYGTFPRVLGRYVRERGVVDLETAVHKMTALPAAQMKLEGVGRLAPGCRADVTLFDPETVTDCATFEDPRKFSQGIPHVFVGGVAVVSEGRVTGALPGKVLRRGQAA